MKGNAHVIGGGIGGVATAAAWQRGWKVVIHERAAELREIGAGIFLKGLDPCAGSARMP